MARLELLKLPLHPRRCMPNSRRRGVAYKVCRCFLRLLVAYVLFRIARSILDWSTTLILRPKTHRLDFLLSMLPLALLGSDL